MKTRAIDNKLFFIPSNEDIEYNQLELDRQANRSKILRASIIGVLLQIVLIAILVIYTNSVIH